MSSVLTLDPGAGNTGWAYWPSLSLDGDAQAPLEFDVWKTRGTWLAKVIAQTRHLRDFVEEAPETQIVIEGTETWLTSSRTIAAATRGDVNKLAFLVGALYVVAERAADEPPRVVKPSEWKGQMGKGAVDARIKRRLGKRYPAHASDAVGLGLWLQGKL